MTKKAKIWPFARNTESVHENVLLLCAHVIPFPIPLLHPISMVERVQRKRIHVGCGSTVVSMVTSQVDHAEEKEEGRGQGREEGKAERREGIGRAEQGKGALWSSSSHGSRNFAEDRVSDMCELDVSLVSNVLTYLA